MSAGYAKIRPLGDGETVHRTIAVSGHLNVDLDEHGWVLGIESLAGIVTKGDLLKVVECMRWQA